MKYTTTLAALREYDACVSGYNKLVCALTGREFDADHPHWIKCDHSDPITLSYILNSNGFDDALWTLRAVEQTPKFHRKCLRYVVWCARRVQHLMDVAERHVNGRATNDEVAAALAVARSTVGARSAADAVWAVAKAAVRAVRFAARATGSQDAADTADAIAWTAVDAVWAAAGSAVGAIGADDAWAAWAATSDAADASRVAARAPDWTAERDAQLAKFVEMFIEGEG